MTNLTESAPKGPTRQSLNSAGFSSQCFFCEDVEGTLHTVVSEKTSCKIKNTATEICDDKILSKLYLNNDSALNVLYHRNCLIDFYNKRRKKIQRQARGNLMKL